MGIQIQDFQSSNSTLKGHFICYQLIITVNLSKGQNTDCNLTKSCNMTISINAIIFSGVQYYIWCTFDDASECPLLRDELENGKDMPQLLSQCGLSLDTKPERPDIAGQSTLGMCIYYLNLHQSVFLENQINMHICIVCISMVVKSQERAPMKVP